jgi:hypothetical protein
MIPNGAFSPQAHVIIFFCCTYNAVLAFLNANVFAISSSMVAATEMLLLGSIGLIVLTSRLQQGDRPYIALLLIVFFSFVLSSLATHIIFVDAIRNMLIIALCAMIGARMKYDSIEAIVFAISAVVFLFLVTELISVPTYVSLLEPANYFATTRGIEDPEFNETGLFANALGFETRFSLGIFSGPRTSSIFLEQVSLANFCNVLAIYTSVFWRYISQQRKIFYVVLILLILASNNSRTASALVLLSGLAYLFNAFIPRYSGFMVVALSLFAGICVYGFTESTYSDDLIGRIHVGIHGLSQIQFSDLWGYGIFNLAKLWDSGWGYLISSSTIFTSVFFVLFVITMMPQKHRIAVQFSFMLNVYVFFNLIIGGNAIFSIKSAAMLWLIAGFLRENSAEFAEEGEHEQA